MTGWSGNGKAELAVREIGLAFPEATEEFPWGHRTLKVKGKAFVFMGTDDAGVFGVSLKLPESGMAALSLPFTEPTGYGLGKSGWVSASFDPKKPVPVALVTAWLRESYCAVAPKKLAAQLREGGASASVSAPKASTRATSAAKKTSVPKRASAVAKPKQGAAAGKTTPRAKKTVAAAAKRKS